MPQSEPVAILLVIETAEEIKLVTLSFRGFFPNCRVEAVYSLEEALQWADRASWHLILVDERLLAQRATPVIPELKRLTPSATIVLQTERSDSNAALNALQAGADFLLYKQSPAFLTELVLYTKDALEKRALRGKLELTQARHDRLIDTLADVLYELDAEGRFVYLSPLATPLLGYTQDELIGRSYSVIVSPDQLDHARHCFTDRRTGTRASQRIEVELVCKASPDKPTPARIRVEISAQGLYDPQRKYLGTLGLLRDVSELRRQEETVHHLEGRLLESDRIVGLARRLLTLSKSLNAHHAVIQSESHVLLKTIRESRLVEQVQSLADHASEAASLAKELAQAATEVVAHQDTINDLINAVLATAQPPLLNTGRIEQSYSPNLPPFTGSADSLTQLLRMLLSYAQRYVAAVGSRHRLRISTTAIGPNGSRMESGPSLSSSTAPADVEIHIQETEAVDSAQESPSLQITGDLFDAYALIRKLGGRWDFLAPVGGLLSIKVWIPVRLASDPNRPPIPLIPLASPASAVIDSPLMARPQTPTLTAPPASLPFARPAQPLADRRKSMRTATNLPARLTIGNMLRNGAMTDLSPSGAALDVEGPLPPLKQQSASLILKTGGAALALQGIAHDRGETSRHAGSERRTSRLAFQFAALDDTEHKVLASLIEEARARTLAVTVEALILPQEKTNDLAAGFAETNLRGTDHREAMRVRVMLPVRIETPWLKAGADRPLGLAVNFSRGGACLQTEPSLKMTDDIVALHFSLTGALDRPRTHEPEAPEAILTGRIVHIASDYTVPSELKPGPSQPGQRIGIRFAQLTPFAEREVNRVIAQHIGSSMDLASIAGRPSIASARRECRNARHQVIAMTDDHARYQISPGIPIVLMIPGFGLTQTDYVPLSYYLAANRFRVIRYDHTNHVGQSDGDILQITLRSMQTDLENVLDFVRATWPTAPLTLFAEDIAARVAVKVMARSNLAAQLVLLNPVLDMETALSATYRSDAAGEYRHGLRRGVANLWGLNVNFDQFVGDALAGEYADLASSTADFSRLATSPIILVSPGTQRPLKDLFGPQRQSLRAMGTAPVPVQLHTDVSAESTAYDERHTQTFRTVIKLISTPMIGSRPSVQMQEPNARDIHRQQQLEQERIRVSHHISQAARNALWVAHLAQLPQLGNLPDYWALENELCGRLLPLEPGMTVLDIGCGQGDLARIMLTNQIYRSAHRSGPPARPLRYIGLDQSQESLVLAERQIRSFAQELPGQLASSVPADRLVETSWVHTDWNSPLPFIEGSIQRILCHLSLSFSSSPLHSLRQALRVLHTDGTAIVTCLQPHTDLSTLFHHQLSATGQDEFGASAQIVLHYLGRLREAIRHGLLHSYERNELARLLTHAGAVPAQIIPVLGNQLLLAIVQKAKSTG